MIAIINYGLGNLHSVYNAFKYLGVDAIITNNKEEILKADKVVLPGVGAFEDAIKTIHALGFDKVIKECVDLNKPLLGICLGMQLLFETSYEYGVHKGLGILKGEVVPFIKEKINLKIPQMGWNDLIDIKDDSLVSNLKSNYVYFVHSYYVKTTSDIVSAYVLYGEKIAVAIEHKNIYATQFHPEKSGDVGIEILKRFGEL